MLERTLSIIKPDAVAAGCTGKILAMIEEAGFRILALRMQRLRREQAEQFYEVHRGKHFYESLVRFMTEGPVVVMALEREDAVARLRDLMGPTDPAKAGEGTVRKLYGTNIERNAIHGSDAPETAERELRFFFSTSELV
ncbi:MAG: nucleoside-diphosphate kinase [Bryobacterales bacterium]|nr:nucleoside-diphosphate kinase [Bryobacteraceae bacterium]MDW8353874.1 nucleoside-diphosphate kinase [Bryobacterales bacterium]